MRFNYLLTLAALTTFFVGTETAQARFLQTDPIGYEDQYNLYAYVHNDPVNNIDPTGKECVNDTEAGTTRCVTDSYDVTINTPEGFENTNPDAEDYHNYAVEGESPLNRDETSQWVVNNPTPGSPNPATAEGTVNDATPVIGGLNLGVSPVVSSTSINQVTGNEVVVNATLLGHPLGNGVVIRETVPNTDGTSTIINYGEGNGYLQSQASPFANRINNVWVRQVPSAPVIFRPDFCRSCP